MKPAISSQVTDALIGDEEQNGKHKKNKKKNREQTLNSSFLEHLIASYDPHRSYGEPVLNPVGLNSMETM